jgi:hypothetical protein
MLGSWAAKELPNLKPSDYDVTSEETPSYNCIGWAAGVTEWWEPDQYDIYYWPPKAPREYTISAYIAAFRSIGYHPCGGPKFEKGNEKVALYADEDGTPTHAAKQLESGQWTSKLGPKEDIEHRSLECLNGPEYGEPVFYLVRQARPQKSTS